MSKLGYWEHVRNQEQDIYHHKLCRGLCSNACNEPYPLSWGWSCLCVDCGGLQWRCADLLPGATCRGSKGDWGRTLRREAVISACSARSAAGNLSLSTRYAGCTPQPQDRGLTNGPLLQCSVSEHIGATANPTQGGYSGPAVNQEMPSAAAVPPTTPDLGSLLAAGEVVAGNQAAIPTADSTLGGLGATAGSCPSDSTQSLKHDASLGNRRVTWHLNPVPETSLYLDYVPGRDALVNAEELAAGACRVVSCTNRWRLSRSWRPERY